MPVEAGSYHELLAGNIQTPIQAVKQSRSRCCGAYGLIHKKVYRIEAKEAFLYPVFLHAKIVVERGRMPLRREKITSVQFSGRASICKISVLQLWIWSLS